jgi:FkbM family methyltransferase
MSVRLAAGRLLRAAGLARYRWPPPNSLLEHLRWLLPMLEVDCVLDVGANRGQFAGHLRAIGYQGWILSFEPNTTLIPRLTTLSAADPCWRVLPFALGNRDGAESLHVPVGDDLGSLLPMSEYARSTFGGVTTGVQVVDIRMQRLDGLLPELQRQIGFTRPFLKMDTQGYDLRVLEGARGCWSHLVGLMSEMSFKALYDGMPDVTESLTAIRSAGFEVTGIFPVVRDATGALIEVDCVARRAAEGEE